MPDAPTLPGLHHVTAICSDLRRNHEFYAGTLGLRLVKKTVNYDAPGMYHLYYGDSAGTPGSVITFFSRPDQPSSRDGTGEVSATAFTTEMSGLDFWQRRLAENAVDVAGPKERFGEAYLEFEDPDGLKLEIVATNPVSSFVPWAGSSVPAERQLRGFHSVTLSEAGYERTQALLSYQMGWTLVKESGGRFRYQAPGAGPASLVDIVCLPAARHALPGTGAVDHVAFRVADEAAQSTWRAALVKLGYNVSPVLDRSYFHSIYYREPGGILFEIATEGPGFAFDEGPGAMGTALMLPPRFEPRRREIEAALPSFT